MNATRVGFGTGIDDHDAVVTPIRRVEPLSIRMNENLARIVFDFYVRWTGRYSIDMLEYSSLFNLFEHRHRRVEFVADEGQWFGRMEREMPRTGPWANVDSCLSLESLAPFVNLVDDDFVRPEVWDVDKFTIRSRSYRVRMKSSLSRCDARSLVLFDRR